MTAIYQIQSKLKPERIYIGSAINIHQRWKIHSSDLRLNRHHSIKLQRHYNKYGKDDLIFSILFECDTKDLIKIEQSLIDLYKPWFNVSPTAGSPLGMKRSPEANQKNRKAHLGKVTSEETKKKQSEAQKGKTFSEEHRKKLREARLGKPLTEETKRKLSEINKGKVRSEESRRKQGEASKGNKYALGYKFTEEQCRKQSEMGYKRWNKPKQGTSSRYKGVFWDKGTSKWRVSLWIMGKRIHLGRFVKEEDAARAYDDAVVKYSVKFADLNFKAA